MPTQTPTNVFYLNLGTTINYENSIILNSDFLSTSSKLSRVHYLEFDGHCNTKAVWKPCYIAGGI